MAKNIKADLFLKLQELKEWQSKQQEKLLSQQKEQHEMALRQQRQTMELIGYRRIVDAENQNPTSVRDYPFDPRNDDGQSKATYHKSISNEEENKSYSFGKESNAENVSLDETPVKSAKMNFKELLEERLQKDRSVNDNPVGSHEPKVNNKPKREFLKKGEGLKRFRMKSKEEFTKTQSSKTCSKARTRMSTNALNTAVSSKNRIPANCNSENQGKFSKGTQAPKSSMKLSLPATGASLEKHTDEKRLNVKFDSQKSESPTWANVLTQESKKLNENKIPVIQVENASAAKVHETVKKPKHDTEDLKVFELLEQMAGDSSFCSTSSTLLGFMESPIISTPLKAILEQKEKLKVSQGTFQHQQSKCTKQLPFGMDSSEDSSSSKDDFDSSSESCYSESEKLAANVGVRALSHGTSRVRFSNHVEKREFDPGIEDATLQETPSMFADQQFKDTEAWSDHASDSSDNSNDEEVTMVSTLGAEFTKDTAGNEKYKTSSAPSLDKYATSSHSSSLSESNKNKDQSRNEPSEIVYKSELLHKRLLELEQEIETFRKDNEELARKKQLQQQAESRWLKEKQEIEKNLKEKEDMLKNTVLEERRKLNREKQVFERYCKELRNQPTKQEREEVQTLQQKLADLQLELRQKESRNSAAQNRISSRLKALEKENMELKDEIEKLKKEKQLESKKRQNRFGNSRSVSNTKSLHAINQQLTQIHTPAVDASIVIKDVVPTKPIPRSLLEEATTGTKGPSKTTKSRGMPSKRNSTSDRDQSNSVSGSHSGVSLRRIQSVPNIVQKVHATISSQSIEDFGETNANEIRCQDKESDVVDSEDDGEEETQVDERWSSDTVQWFNGERTDSRKIPDTVYVPNLSVPSTHVPKLCSLEKQTECELTNKTLSDVACDALYPKDKISHQNVIQQRKVPIVPSVSTAFPMEKVNSDGSREIRYENGNFKRISPDGLITKLFYFNGDVKENLADGTVKYYYSETRTWHTTLPDGLEILEFPNGQVERHFNGTTEVSFPDGTVRLLHRNGREELILPDGTMATTEPNGDKVIQLPNGQKEFQTRDYKKRVYPDGTVKIVYSDGVQETRYSNGRVRLRDSNGSLVMDSES